MPTITDVRELDKHLSVALSPTGKSLEFDLKDEDYRLLHFKNEKVFGTRWLLLKKGSTTIDFKDVKQETELIFHSEKDMKFAPDLVKMGPIKIPPPPGTR